MKNRLQDIDITQLSNIPLSGKFEARCIKCYDGDTPTFVIINSYNEPQIINCRLYGIDTPEMKGDKHIDAIKSRNRLIQLVTDQFIELDKEYSKDELQNIFINNKKTCILECIGKHEKYGRTLANIFVDDISCCQILLQEGLGNSYYGGTKKL